MRLRVRFVLLTLALRMLLNAAALGKDVPTHKVDQIFSLYDKTGSPGCSLGVIRERDFVYRKAYGLANLELGVPLSPHSVFYMGSVSKQFTAAAILLAAEQGYLSLDDDVRKYIQELPDYGHAIMGADRMTVHRNLREARLILRDVFNADGKLFLNC